MTKRVKNARVVLFLVAGGLLTYYLLSRSGSLEVTVSNIFLALKQADLKWFFIAFISFALTQLTRALRWKALAWDHKVSLNKSVPITAVHVGLGHVLPVRLADVAVVGLFKKYSSLPLSNGTATVLLAKIMDVIAMSFVVACSFIGGLSGSVIYISSAALLIGLLSLFFLPYILSIFTKPVKAIFGGNKFTEGWLEMTEAVKVTNKRKKQVSIAMLLSIAGWSIKLFMFYALLHAVSVTTLPMWKIFTASAITDFTLALPIHGLLSLGTVEAGWVAGFSLVGVTGILPGGLSIIELGFSIHLLWLFMAILLMLGGTVALVLSNRKVQN